MEPLFSGVYNPPSGTQLAFAGAVTLTTWLGDTYNPEECISMSDVLRIRTMGPAYASFEEDKKDSIEVGKAGDLVVWSHDLLAQDPINNLIENLRYVFLPVRNHKSKKGFIT
jgi:predicted amidohydrolase YtcJ